MRSARRSWRLQIVLWALVFAVGLGSMGLIAGPLSPMSRMEGCRVIQGQGVGVALAVLAVILSSIWSAVKSSDLPKADGAGQSAQQFPRLRIVLWALVGAVLMFLHYAASLAEYVMSGTAVPSLRHFLFPFTRRGWFFYLLAMGVFLAMGVLLAFIRLQRLRSQAPSCCTGTSAPWCKTGSAT